MFRFFIIIILFVYSLGLTAQEYTFEYIRTEEPDIVIILTVPTKVALHSNFIEIKPQYGPSKKIPFLKKEKYYDREIYYTDGYGTYNLNDIHSCPKLLVKLSDKKRIIYFSK